MCIQFKTFLGKWELSTGCLVAAVLGPIYTTLFSVHFWLGPYSSVKLPDWTIYIKIAITVYNCLVAVGAFFFAYGILKEKLWAVKLYKNMWNYITMTVISIFIWELLVMTMVYPKLYLESMSIVLNILFLTGINVYFSLIIRSYEKEKSA
ncbi:uncharacterized protein [Choristoneura fumiferana]|uniref:uncharacterized protein n=1 Tax=Choristoneura fumiferana TaxID=7141 RepID=UPI003D15B178